MLVHSGKLIPIVILENPVHHPIRMVGQELETVADFATIKAEARAIASQLLAKNDFTSFSASGIVRTARGTFKLFAPITGNTRVVVASGPTTPVIDAAIVLAKAPAHKQQRTVMSTRFEGTFIVTAYCAIIESAIQYETAVRYAMTGKGTDRRTRAEVMLDEAIRSFQQNPVGAVAALMRTPTRMYMSLRSDIRSSLLQTTSEEPFIDGLVTQYMEQIDSTVEDPIPAPQRAEVSSSLEASIRRSVGRMVDVGQLSPRVLTEAEVESVKTQLGSYIAQPSILLDILGTQFEEIEVEAFADLVSEVAKRISNNLAESKVFSTKDTPRSLAEMLWYGVGLRDTKFAESVEAFYHRALRPELNPVDAGPDFDVLFRVHPAFLGEGFTSTWDSTGRVGTITYGGVSVTATYPDWLDKDVSYTSENAGEAVSLINAYHSFLDLVYSYIAIDGNGRVSPERLLQLGLNGVQTSNIFSVR